MHLLADVFQWSRSYTLPIHILKFLDVIGFNEEAPKGNPIKYSALSGVGLPKTSLKFLHPWCFIIDGAE